MRHLLPLLKDVLPACLRRWAGLALLAWCGGALAQVGAAPAPYKLRVVGGLAGVSASQLAGAELDSYRRAESQAIVHGYLGIAVALAVVALAVWLFRNRLQGERHEASSGLAGLDLLKRPRFGLGARRQR